MEGDYQASATRPLDLREPPQSREASVLARCLAAKDHSPGVIASRDHQENWEAYLSPHFFDASYWQRREREGSSGIDAAYQHSLQPGGLFPGANLGKAPTPAERSYET